MGVINQNYYEVSVMEQCGPLRRVVEEMDLIRLVMQLMLMWLLVALWSDRVSFKDRKRTRCVSKYPAQESLNETRGNTSRWCTVDFREIILSVLFSNVIYLYLFFQ